jgi:hypothetical protein
MLYLSAKCRRQLQQIAEWWHRETGRVWPEGRVVEWAVYTAAETYAAGRRPWTVAVGRAPIGKNETARLLLSEECRDQIKKLTAVDPRRLLAGGTKPDSRAGVVRKAVAALYAREARKREGGGS